MRLPKLRVQGISLCVIGGDAGSTVNCAVRCKIRKLQGCAKKHNEAQRGQAIIGLSHTIWLVVSIGSNSPDSSRDSSSIVVAMTGAVTDRKKMPRLRLISFKRRPIINSAGLH